MYISRIFLPEIHDRALASKTHRTRMERSYWPLVISHCLGDVSWGVTNASSKAGPKDIPGYLGTWPSSYVRMDTSVYVCNNGEQGEAVTRRILVEPRLGSKTLPQITEPLSYPFVYWSILRRCNGTWETLACCSLDWTKEKKRLR